MDRSWQVLQCIVPQYVLEHLSNSNDPATRKLALDNARLSAAARATRRTLAALPTLAAIPSPTKAKHRLVYSMQQTRFPLPGELIRGEGQGKSQDEAVNEAYDFTGVTYDFYKTILGRNSLDNQGMSLISSVHFGRNFANAFWEGSQMVFGDGDGRLFTRFTKSIDVVGHELTHGVVMHESNLVYQDEPGALNEHFADVFGTLVKQWHLGHSVDKADWLIGADIMGPGTEVRALRTFKNEKAYDDPEFGTDPQPKHMKDKYTGDEDSGGVHINSGIPNNAFYRAAVALGGNAWETLGKVWYETLRRLNKTSSFAEAVRISIQAAGETEGGVEKQRALREAWAAVGLAPNVV